MLPRYSFYIVLLGFGFVFPMATWAAFVPPSQSPPSGNVPGVIWNMPASNQSGQAGTEFNISGGGRLGGDLYFSDSKAIRIDAVGDTWFNMGNWSTGKFTLNVIGDIQTDSSDGALGNVTLAPSGKVTASQFCIGSNCISTWPSGGSASPGAGGSPGGGSSFDGNSYVLKNGDTMTGALILNANPDPSTPFGAATKQYVDAMNGLKINKAGDTMTGALVLNGDPSAALGAATKQYVDSSTSGKVNRAGDTMGGTLTLHNAPVAPFDAATKQYVDASSGGKINRVGDAMTGALTLNGNPVQPLQAATKQYVDAIAGAAASAGSGGTITGVTAGTGLQGGGTSGNVTLGLSNTYTNGSAFDPRFVLKGGDTMTGPLVLNADPSAALGAASKQYVDAGTSLKVGKAGDAMTGALILNADPNAALGAATKQYVDAGSNLKVNKAGDTMTGALILNANPSAALGAATKQYVDTGDAANVKKTGDIMSGSLYAPFLTAQDFQISRAGNLIQTTAYQVPGQASVLEFVTNSGSKFRMVDALSGAFLYGVNSGVNSPSKYFYFNRLDGIDLSGVSQNASLSWVEKQSPIPVGAPQHTQGSLGFNSGNNHFGIESEAYTPQATAGSFQNYSGGTTRSALLGTPTAAGNFTGKVVVNYAGVSNGAIDGSGGLYGGFFQNLSNPNYFGWIGYNGYGGYFSAPAGGLSIYATQDVSVGGSLSVANKVNISGDLVAPSNALSSCTWQPTPLNSTNYICPSNQIMAGIHKSATAAVDQIYCCAL